MGMFDLYYKKLKAKMSGQPPMNLQEAMAALKAELQEAREAANQRLPEQVRDRLEYPRRCSDALMDCAADRIRKEAARDAAVERIRGILKKPELKLSSGTGDWMVSLMKTGDTLQDRGHNEKLIAQMALCNGQINAGQYGFIREMWYKSYNRAVPEEANDHYGPIIQREKSTAAADLLGALEEKLQLGQQHLEEARDSAGKIIQLNADDETLSSAFHIVESDEIRLLENVQTCLDDFEKFEKDRKLPEDKSPKRELWPPVEKARMEMYRKTAEAEAEMHYNAMRDRQAAEGKPEDVPQEEPAREKKAPAELTLAEKTVLKNEKLDEHLKPYGLTWEDDAIHNASGYTAYCKEAGETVILKAEGVETADGYEIKISDDAPGRLVNYDLDEQTRLMKNKVKYLEAQQPHTKEYKDLKAAMDKLTGLKLDDQPSREQAREAANRFHVFGLALEAYIKMREHKPDPGQRSEWYKGAVRDLRTFARSKENGIEMVNGHIDTMTARELGGQEVEAAINAAQAKPKRKAGGLGLPDTYINIAMRWSAEFSNAIDAHDEQMENAWDAAISRAKRDGLQKVTPPAPIPLTLLQIYDMTNKPDLLAEKLQLKILLGTPYYDPAPADDPAPANGAAQAQKNDRPPRTLYDAALEGRLGPRELADMMAKNALACEVVKELVKMEEKLDVKVDPPIKTLIDGGRIYDVVDMVKKSQSFGEHYRFLDLSRNAEQELDAIRNAKAKADPPAPAEVAKEILQSYLDRQKAVQNQKKADAGKGIQPPANQIQNQKGAQPVLKNDKLNLQPPVK